ncbi:MAG: phosphatase PAP2 family protein [bacterium]|nr:phosphatase PAP2 family protein [bacterium]
MGSNHLAKEVVFVLLIFSILGAISLALLVQIHPVSSVDVRITRGLQNNGNEGLLSLMQFVSLFGDPPVAIAMIFGTAALFFFFAHPLEALFVLMTPLANGIDVFIKALIARPRPVDSLVTVYQNLTDASFPSGHVVYYVVFFGFLATTMFVIQKIPRLMRVAVVVFSLALITLISVSRVYLGVHWASDVIGGYLTGFVLLTTLLYFYFKRVELRTAKA